jgi:hypothetical protein
LSFEPPRDIGNDFNAEATVTGKPPAGERTVSRKQAPGVLVVDSEDPAAAPAYLDPLAVDDEESWLEEREDALLYR